jgi:hypothetical protein
MCFHNSHWVFRSLAQAARIEAGLAAPVACVFITPKVPSKPSRRPIGLKVGYASSRAHDNKQDQSLGFGFSSYIKLETWLKVMHMSLVFS